MHEIGLGDMVWEGNVASAAAATAAGAVSVTGTLEPFKWSAKRDEAAETPRLLQHFRNQLGGAGVVADASSDDGFAIIDVRARGQVLELSVHGKARSISARS